MFLYFVGWWSCSIWLGCISDQIHGLINNILYWDSIISIGCNNELNNLSVFAVHGIKIAQVDTNPNKYKPNNKDRFLLILECRCIHSRSQDPSQHP